jgi:ferritin-like metal-binding protein YciE
MSIKSVFCIATSRLQADQIVDQLKDAHFSSNDISALFADQSTNRDFAHEKRRHRHGASCISDREHGRESRRLSHHLRPGKAGRGNRLDSFKLNLQTQMKTLQHLFLGELADIYDAEQRLLKAWPKMARAATCTHLRKAILAHLEETQGHVTKVAQIFECFDRKATGKTCKAAIGLLEEGDEIAEEYAGSPAINAALIATAQKVEHYEIAVYGCLHEWACRLGNQKAADILEEILNEEKAANACLTDLALTRSNDEALDETDAEAAADPSDKKPGAEQRGAITTSANA